MNGRQSAGLSVPRLNYKETDFVLHVFLAFSWLTCSERNKLLCLHYIMEKLMWKKKIKTDVSSQQPAKIWEYSHMSELRRVSLPNPPLRCLQTQTISDQSLWDTMSPKPQLSCTKIFDPQKLQYNKCLVFFKLLYFGLICLVVIDNKYNEINPK